MDLKYEQYRKGEQFVRAIARLRGPVALARLWDRPGDAAAPGEIEAPERWVARVIDGVGGMSVPGGDIRKRHAGPGSGPRGAPTAIALSPILSARYRARDLERIRAAAPGARLVMVSVEGLADGPVDEVEVMLRGWLSSDAFDRLLARAPRLSWVHSATSGVERALTPAALERGLVVTNARGVFSRPIAEYVLMMILAISRRLPQLLELQRERTWQPLEGTELRDVTVGIIGLGLDRTGGRRVGDQLRLPGRRGPATFTTRSFDPSDRGDDEPDVRTGRARPGRRSRYARGAAVRIGLHRPGGAAYARDRGDDQRRDAGT